MYLKVKPNTGGKILFFYYPKTASEIKQNEVIVTLISRNKTYPLIKCTKKIEIRKVAF